MQLMSQEPEKIGGSRSQKQICSYKSVIQMINGSYLTLPYLQGGLTPSAETSSVGPVRNPQVPEGCHNLLEALANLKREDH